MSERPHDDLLENYLKRQKHIEQTSVGSGRNSMPETTPLNPAEQFGAVMVRAVQVPFKIAAALFKGVRRDDG